jgi:hypothetical protein
MSMLNVNKFYKEGYDVWQMPSDLNAILWSSIISETYNQHTVYKGIPTWSINNDMVAGSVERVYDRKTEQEMAKRSLELVPKVYTDCITELFKNNYYNEWFINTCGYKWELRFIDLWNGSDNLDWHWDGVEDHDIGFLIYFTEEPEWKSDWGSVLKLGERDYGSNSVTDIGQVNPNNGTVVLLNNMNPRFVHSVNPLQDITKNRYTINAGISLWN